MFDRCFRCGQEGHTRRQCPQAKDTPAARAPRAARWVKPEPPQRRHNYPDDHWLLYACAFCGAAKFMPCINVGTGRNRAPHHARLDLLRLSAEETPTRPLRLIR